MQDEPTPVEMLGAVATFLRDTVVPATAGMVAFQARVAANAVDLVARQVAADDGGEAARLRALMGRDGPLPDLNAALAAGIADGSIDYAAPETLQHLWATTLAKLAVDQPRYSGYLAALVEKDA